MPFYCDCLQSTQSTKTIYHNNTVSLQLVFGCAYFEINGGVYKPSLFCRRVRTLPIVQSLCDIYSNTWHRYKYKIAILYNSVPFESSNKFSFHPFRVETFVLRYLSNSHVVPEFFSQLLLLAHIAIRILNPKKGFSPFTGFLTRRSGFIADINCIYSLIEFAKDIFPKDRSKLIYKHPFIQ